MKEDVIESLLRRVAKLEGAGSVEDERFARDIAAGDVTGKTYHLTRSHMVTSGRQIDDCEFIFPRGFRGPYMEFEGSVYVYHCTFTKTA